MNRVEFRAFLNLLMCSDPWPTGPEGQVVLSAWADQQARELGYNDWLDAYHILEVRF